MGIWTWSLSWCCSTLPIELLGQLGQVDIVWVNSKPIYDGCDVTPDSSCDRARHRHRRDQTSNSCSGQNISGICCCCLSSTKKQQLSSPFIPICGSNSWHSRITIYIHLYSSSNWPDSLIGRALHQCCRGEGLNPHSGQSFLGLSHCCLSSTKKLGWSSTSIQKWYCRFVLVLPQP